MNSGIKFTFAESFRNRFPGSGITLRDNNSKVLFYAYNERRYAYFMPGTIDLLYTKSNGEDTLLLRREVVEKQMLTLNLSYSPLHKDISSFIRIGLDTTRYWNNKDYNIGISLPQGTLSVAEAKAAVGEKGVMVFGYIVGTDATANSIRVGPPFSSDTYIIIGDSRSDFNSERLMAVELPSKSQIREDLNLVSHPELVGAAVIHRRYSGILPESWKRFKEYKGLHPLGVTCSIAGFCNSCGSDIKRVQISQLHRRHRRQCLLYSPAAILH